MTRKCEMECCASPATELHVELRAGDDQAVDRRVFCTQHGEWQHQLREKRFGRRGEERATYWDVRTLAAPTEAAS